MCLCLSFAVWATDYTWTGGGNDGNWENPDNWDGSGFPSTGDNAVISQDVTITEPETGINLQKITIVENFSLTLGSTVKMNVVENNPFTKLASQKADKPLPIVMKSSEIETLLDGVVSYWNDMVTLGTAKSPEAAEFSKLRDIAIIEVIYSGIV